MNTHTYANKHTRASLSDKNAQTWEDTDSVYKENNVSQNEACSGGSTSLGDIEHMLQTMGISYEDS